MDWDAARDAAHDLYDGADNDCGLSDHSAANDWRLPTRAEWEEFFNAHLEIYRREVVFGAPCGSPYAPGLCHWAYEENPFIDGASVSVAWFWTGTAESATGAWAANTQQFRFAELWQGADDAWVWPVRSTKVIFQQRYVMSHRILAKPSISEGFMYFPTSQNFPYLCHQFWELDTERIL